MKNIKTNIDIKIENGVNKVYGIDKLNDADRKKADHAINKLAFRKLKEDNAKAKFAKFIKTETGEKFINKLDIIALKPLCDQFHLGYLLLWKDYNAVRAIIDEIMSGLKIEKPVISHPKDYGTWTREKFHALPKNLTTKKMTVKTIGYNFYGQDPSLPFWKRVSTTKIVPSEVGTFNEKYTDLRFKDEDERTDALVEHKFKKWQKRNPKPDATGDLFPDTINQAWVKREIAARKSIRMMIENNHKRKLDLIVRIKTSDDLYTEKQATILSFKRHIADKINDTEQNKAVLNAHHILNQIKENGNNLVCGYLKNRDLNIGRCLIPAA